MSIVGRRAEKLQIPAPTGQKLEGKIIEINQSERFPELIDLNIEIPEFKVKLKDGKTEFKKRVYYSIPINWSPKNKAGRLHKAVLGRLPGEEEPVMWEQLLKNLEVLVILEDKLDPDTGEVLGQKIKWIGPKNQPEIFDGDDLPPHIQEREPGIDV